MSSDASDGCQRLNLGVLEAGQQKQQIALLIDQRLTMPLGSLPSSSQLINLYTVVPKSQSDNKTANIYQKNNGKMAWRGVV